MIGSVSGVIVVHLGLSNPQSTDLIISEVLYDTPACDSTCEWVELYNPTTSAIDITGWTLWDNSKSNLLPSVVIPSGGYFVFARSNTGFQSLYNKLPDSGAMTLALGNSGDVLRLKNSAGTEVDMVAWENYITGWSVSAVDSTIYRPTTTDTDSVSDWADSKSLGTPGSGYSSPTDTISPNVTISSPIDGTTVSGSVLFSCSATDNSGVISSYSLKIDGIIKSSSNNYTWDTTADSDGSHTLRCEAMDTSSNTGFAEIAVNVNNTSPIKTFNVYFTDPLAGVPRMESPSLQKGNISTGIVDLLNSATGSIDAALYHLSWQPVIDALLNANTRGVTVRIAADASNLNEFTVLSSAGISVTAVNTSKIMHNKFFIVDSQYVFTGSWNPTETGTLFNANDAIKIKSPQLATVFQAEFDQLFANIYGTKKTDNNAEIVTVGSTTVEAYFAPKDTGLTRLIQLIDGATTSIYLSLFYFTDNSIYDAILRARDRGVLVRGVFDYRGWRNAYSEADDVIAWGGGVVDANPGVNHHKFGVFDGKIVWTGSTNWSASGFSGNDENSVVIHDIGVASHYIARVNDFYTDAQNYDNSSSQAPRIVTRHYSGYPGSNFIQWRPHLNGNTPKKLVDTYVLWRWNPTISQFEELQELNWAVGYYSDSDIVLDQTYYYCVSSRTNGLDSGCSAEFAQVQYSGGGSSQPVLSTATGHLTSFGTDKVAPVVQFRSHITGQTVNGWQTIVYSGNDTSARSSWELLIDGSVVSRNSLFLLDTTKLVDGMHTLEARVTDEFGNVGTKTITLNVDNSAYTPISPVNFASIKFMTYNIEASGTNPGFKDVLKEENADIVVLVEAGNFDDNGNFSINSLVMELNQYFSTELPYSFALTQGQGSKYTGIAVLSRFQISNSLLIPLVTLDNGYKFDVSHDFIDVTLLVGTGILHVIGSHLKAKSGASNEIKREKAQEGIINYMDTLGASANIIYAGDLNSFSPQDTGSLAPNGDLGYGPINMTINPLHSGYPLVQSFTDMYRSLNPTTPGYTYYTAPYESRIDFILTNGYLNSKGLGSTVGDTPSSNLGSDHYSVDVTFNLTDWAPLDTTPPSQVTGLSANVISPSQIDLSWTGNPENDVVSYKIYRNNTLIATISTTSFSDKGLSAGTTYVYQVSALDSSANEGAKSLQVSATTLSSSGLNHIIISEVFYDTPGTDSAEEWIELYNPTTVPVDLSGWTLSDNRGVFTLPSGTTIGVNSFLVVARNAAGYFALYNKNPDVSGMTLSLGNSGDVLRLKNLGGTEVDMVAWENYIVGWSIFAKTGQSISRVSLTSDSDTVNDWIVTLSNGTPGTLSSPPRTKTV